MGVHLWQIVQAGDKYDLNTKIKNFFAGTIVKSPIPEKRTLLESDLRKWTTEKLQPSIWKKYFCNDQYESLQQQNKNNYDDLFGTALTQHDIVDRRTIVTNPEIGYSKAEFISLITEHLRDSDKGQNVCIIFLFDKLDNS